MIARLYLALLTAACFASITYGAHLVWPPAGYLALGLCLWVDLYLGRRLRGSGR